MITGTFLFLFGPSVRMPVLQFLLSALPELVTLQLTLFPAPPTGSPEFPTMAALETGAGQQLLGRLTTLRFLASRPAHLPRLHQLLGHTPSLETLVLEHLQLPHLPPHQAGPLLS